MSSLVPHLHASFDDLQEPCESPGHKPLVNNNYTQNRESTVYMKSISSSSGTNIVIIKVLPFKTQ